MGSSRQRPPRLLRGVLGRLLPGGESGFVLGEMDDLYARRCERDGRASASLWYARHVVLFPIRLVWEGLVALPGRIGWSLRAVGRDAAHGARVLIRRRGYTVASVATLGVGVGALACVYSAANWVLLRPVPGVPDDAFLATVQLELREGAGFAFPMSNPDLRDIESGVRSLERVAASTEHEVHVQVTQTTFAGSAGNGRRSGDQEGRSAVEAAGEMAPPRRLTAEVVTAAYFDVLGITPALGLRQSGEPGTVVISNRLWRQAWGGSPDVLGSDVRVNGHPYRVVGVSPAGFRGAELPGRADLWLPASALPHVDPSLPPDVLARRGSAVWRDMVAVLAPGARPDRIQAEAERVIVSIREARGYPNSFAADFVVRTYPGLGLSPRVRDGVRRTLRLLAGTATLLLLLALANATNLGLAHGAARAGQVAVHRALGAGGPRLVQRVLVEHLLLGFAGAFTGILVAFAGMLLFRHASLSPFGASLDGIALDGRVLAFTGMLAAGCGLVAGVLPALGSIRTDLIGSLDGLRHGRRKGLRVQAGLVVSQVALSTLLLVGAGLLVHSVLELRATELGFQPDRALRLSIDPRIQGDDDARVADLATRAVRRIEAIRGVEAAGFVAPSPVRASYFTTALYRSDGDPEKDVVRGAQFEATARFLPAMGASLIAGRWFRDEEWTTGSDLTEAPVVISRSMAQGAFPNLPPEAAVGRVLLSTYDQSPPARVVGVFEDMRIISLTDETPPLVFYPWDTGYGFELTVWVRTTAGNGPSAIAGPVVAALDEVDPALPVYEMRPARAQVDALIVDDRVVARLALALAVVGLFLAGVGLQGVLGYAVTMRRREIGVRAALGATPGVIMAAFVQRGVLLTVCGATIGFASAFALARVIEARLHGMSTLDPLTYIVVGITLLATAVLAVIGPARRSTRVPPTEALVAE